MKPEEELAVEEGVEVILKQATEKASFASRIEQSIQSFPPTLLTAREVEVLSLVALGLTNSQIAQEMAISPKTVNAHLASIYSKLHISSRNAATRYALEHHLVKLPSPQALLARLDHGLQVLTGEEPDCLAFDGEAERELSGMQQNLCLDRAEYMRTRAQAAGETLSLITPASPPHVELTAREVEVLRLLALGLTNNQIAEHLTISARTVNIHVQSIYGKLRIKSRNAATHYAIEHNLT